VLLAPLLTFPMTLMLPAAAVAAWRGRNEPGVRFALAWLLPAWAVFEVMPTKLPHYTLPLYGALAWLAAAGLSRPIGRASRWTGAALSGLVGLLLAGVVLYLARRFGDASDIPYAGLAALALAGAGVAGGWLLVRDRPRHALVAGLGLAILGHAVLLAALAPRLLPLWLSARTEAALERAKLLPRQGVADAPVAVAGYAEPSLVFAVGTATELDDAQEAAQAIAENRPAVVESRQEAAFQSALKAAGAVALPVARLKGLDYSNGQAMTLTVYEAPETAEQSR